MAQHLSNKTKITKSTYRNICWLVIMGVLNKFTLEIDRYTPCMDIDKLDLMCVCVCVFLSCNFQIGKLLILKIWNLYINYINIAYTVCITHITHKYIGTYCDLDPVSCKSFELAVSDSNENNFNLIIINTFSAMHGSQRAMYRICSRYIFNQCSLCSHLNWFVRIMLKLLIIFIQYNIENYDYYIEIKWYNQKWERGSLTIQIKVCVCVFFVF